MCNTKRKRRGFIVNASCDKRKNVDEDLDHIFRTCEQIKEIWKAYIPKRERHRLEKMNFTEWLSNKLRGKVDTNKEEKLREIFATAIWWIWKWRNAAVLNNEQWEDVQKINWLCQQKKEIAMVFFKFGKPGVTMFIIKATIKE